MEISVIKQWHQWPGQNLAKTSESWGFKVSWSSGANLSHYGHIQIMDNDRLTNKLTNWSVRQIERTTSWDRPVGSIKGFLDGLRMISGQASALVAVRGGNWKRL